MKRILPHIAIFAASFILALFFCEIIVRIFIPQQLIEISDDIWVEDSLVGWRTSPNLNTTVNTGDRTVHLFTDENGYRINRPELRESADSSAINILFLGDSFIHGFEVESSETLPKVTAKKLTEQFDIPVQAVNAGIRGYNTGQYYLTAKRALEVEDFDLAVVSLWLADDCFEGIDTTFQPYHIKQTKRFRMPKSLFFEEIIDALLYPFNDMMERHSHLFVFMKNRLEFFLARMGLTAKVFPEVFYKSAGDNKAIWNDSAETCGFISEVFRQKGIPVMFIFLPAEFQVYDKLFYDYIDIFNIPEDSVDIFLPNRMMAEVFARDSLSYIDVLPYLQDEAEKGEDLFCQVDIHLNAKGLEKTAECVLPHIEKLIKSILERKN